MSQVHAVKVSDRQVREIRALRADTGLLLRQIGDLYGISESQVSRIVSGKARMPLEAQ